MTVAPPIREPSVDIFQEVAPVPAVAQEETLPACCVAPNYQVLRQQDEAGNLNPDALMGLYKDLDETITYALPGLEQGAVFQGSTLRAFLSLGNDVRELDDEASEQDIIDSTATSIVHDTPAADEHTLTDSVQDFVASGILGSQDIEGNDYVVRMLGTDGEVHDFPILVVAPGSVVTILEIGSSPVGGVKPSLVDLDYEIVLNPAKFVLNTGAIKAGLRVDTATASVVMTPVGTPAGDVLFTSLAPGGDGNGLSVEYQNNGAGTLATTASVLNGADIIIDLETDGFGVSQAIGSDIVAAIIASAAASTLVTAALTVGGDGPVEAIAQTSLAGGAHIEYEATTAGVLGNQIRVMYVQPTSLGALLTLSLVGTDLTISLATDGGGAPASTDDDIAAAMALDLVISALLTATAYSGTVIITPNPVTTFTYLEGGFDANSVTVDANLIGNASASGYVYVYYKALRLTFTALASLSTTGNDPVLASASNVSDLEALVGELTEENPLGLMMSLALQNNTNSLIYGLGVDAVSPAEPDGTSEAWQRAADFLTTQIPYYIAVASQRGEIHDRWLAHIDLMNGDGFTTPAILERFLFINKVLPLTTPDTLLASGTNMDKVGSDYVAGFNFTLAGILAGDVLILRDGTGTLIDDGDSDAELQDGTGGYLVASVSGGGFALTLTGTGPASAVVNASFQVYREGSPLWVGGVFNKQLIAETVSLINDEIDRRKVSSTFPDNCIVSVGGIQKFLPGYYLDAAQVGQCAGQRPSRSKLRQALLGIDGVRFSSEFFSNAQLDVIQGGGTWTYHQPVPNGAVLTRHTLTTDNLNPLVRNPTSTWQVDRYSRLIRTSIRYSLGGTITQALLDDLLMKMGAIRRHLIERQELRTATIDSIRQGDGVEADIDNIIVEGEASPLQPNNGIRFFLTIAA